MVDAAIAGDLDLVRSLVSGGSDVNEADQFGWLPIHRAAANNRGTVIAYLVSQGSTIEARGTDQWTPLHLACVSGSARTVVALLSVGADPNSVARNDNTPLLLAVTPLLEPRFGQLHADSLRDVTEVIRTLLRAGADAGARNVRGETAAAIARRKGAPELAAFLDEAATARE